MKDCDNCTFGQYDAGDPSVGIGTCIECCCDLDDFPFHLLNRYGEHTSVMPQFCGHYSPERAGDCPACGVDMGPTHAIQFWAITEYTPCCSQRCRDAIEVATAQAAADDRALEAEAAALFMQPDPLCPHGMAWHECDPCMLAGDQAYDAARERRFR